MKRWGVGMLAVGALLLAGCSSDDGDKSAATAQPPVQSTQHEPDETAVDEPVAEESGDDATARDVEKYILESFGADSFGEALAQNPDGWAGRIQEVKFSNGNAHILTAYTTSDKAEGTQTANAIANLISLGSPELSKKVDWIIVEDGTGTIIAQKQV